MAKKKQDDFENNDDINDQNQDDFNELDDNFGLPEVDYTPLDETSDEPEASDDSSNTEEEGSYSSYSDTEESEESEETEVSAYASDEYESNQEEEQEYVPGSYTPPVEESSNVGKIIGIILFAVIVSVGAWYMFYYRPAQIEKAKIEQAKKDKAEQERIAQEKKAEEERRAREAAEAEAARLAAEEAAKPKIGTIEAISSRTGRFYCVVASAIDGDLAMDYAKKLSKKGVSVTLIPPFGKSKFHRVTVDNLDSWAAAENRATELKGEFGEDVWVIKY